jgi:hypothetical protein
MLTVSSPLLPVDVRLSGLRPPGSVVAVFGSVVAARSAVAAGLRQAGVLAGVLAEVAAAGCAGWEPGA